MTGLHNCVCSTVGVSVLCYISYKVYTFSMEKRKCSDTPVRTFVMLDLETTGLYNKPRKITEIAMVAALREHILGFGSDINELGLPRVLSKVCICVNPMKMISPGAIEVAGLSNELLVSLNPFDEELFSILDCFIRRLPKPVCIIAHNGKNFDFPILQNALQRIGKAFPDHVLCADSYHAFRELFRKDNLRKMLNNEVPQIATKIECTHSTVEAPLNNIENPSSKEFIIDDDLLGDICPLEEDLSTENKHVSNTRNEEYPESEENGLCEDGYEDTLYEALEAIEASPMYKPDDVEKLNNIIDELDASLTVTRTKTKFEITASNIKSEELENEEDNTLKLNTENVNQLDEAHAIQETIQKTPSKFNSQRQSFSKYSSNNGHSRKPIKTPTKGKRGGDSTVNKARKRLNFYPEKEEHIAVPKSLKLGDVYRFLLQREPVNCHRAENDCLILLECIVALQDNFIQWVERNAIYLNSVKSEMSR